MIATPSPFRADLGAGFLDILPAVVACVPIALLFGALGAAKGLSPGEVTLASAVIFAGGAQLAAIQLWSDPAPVAALIVSTLLINARFALMSASLVPKMPRRARLPFLLVLVDETWAMAERRAEHHPLTGAHLLGVGLTLWANWVVWSWAGARLGPFLGDPARFGADFAFTALFIALIVGFVRGRGPRAPIVVAASAAAATLAHLTLGPPWHVLAGAAAGIAVAAVLTVPREATP